ncbi:MAG: kinase [Clostridiales bacterium]|nr:kinase [Clostridiales bacterium]
MHKLIILRGNSGSGKTTVAKALQQEFGENTMLISQDMIRREILKVSDGVDTKALPFLQELLRYGKQHSEIVILEGILVAEWYRPLFELAVELYGHDLYAYYFDIPFEETIRRHKTRAKSSEFGENEMRSWWVDKDYSPVLHEERISAELDKESIVRKIVDTVTQKTF